MTDPRVALRAAYAQWLRVRANVRALSASLAAAEYGLRRDARRSDDRDLTTLAEQLAGERRAIDALAADLDARIAYVRDECNALEAAHLRLLTSQAGTSRTQP